MAAAVLAWLPAAAAAQIVPAPPALPEANATSFSIFIGGRPLGSEQIAVNARRRRLADRQHRPHRRADRRRCKAPAGPIHRRLAAAVVRLRRHAARRRANVHTSVEGTDASSNVTVGRPDDAEDRRDRSQRAAPPATNFFAPYEAVAARVKTAAAGTDIPAYAEGPMISFRSASANRRPSRFRRRRASYRAPHGAHHGAARRDHRRDDLDRRSRPPGAIQRARTIARRRPRGHCRRVVAHRHHFAAERRTRARSRATASRSPAPCPARLRCAGVAVAGRRPCRRQRPDRSRRAWSFGIPVLGELAGALAEAGFLSIRYDKRGVGQSGGRAESATLTDYAEDARAAVDSWPIARTSIPKRIAILGHSEGGLVALIAADKEKRIDAVR